MKRKTKGTGSTAATADDAAQLFYWAAVAHKGALRHVYPTEEEAQRAVSRLLKDKRHKDAHVERGGPRV